MTILSDYWIEEQVKKNNLITNFVEAQTKDIEGVKALSFGLSSFGYDARLAREFRIFKSSIPNSQTIIDPKDFNSDVCEYIEDDFCVIPPNGFALGVTIEEFNLPRDVFAICIGKSTYARCGIIVNVTPLEPESSGKVTLEFSNTTSFPVKLYANEGVCQFLFFKGDKDCKISYKDKNGKYLNQKTVTEPKI